jgi:hypothetical protein
VSRPVTVTAGREHASRRELLHLADGLLTRAIPSERRRRQESVNTVLDWLEGFPAGTGRNAGYSAAPMRQDRRGDRVICRNVSAAG